MAGVKERFFIVSSARVLRVTKSAHPFTLAKILPLSV